MKILTGDFRGRGISFTGKTTFRPTSNKTREAFVNVASALLRGAVVADLFSGSGAVGFEALSNGAAEVLFAEERRDLCRGIEKTAEKLGVREKARIYCCDVEQALRLMSEEHRKADLVYSDPPYGMRMNEEAMELAGALGVVREKGWFAAETRKDEEPPENVGPFTRRKVFSYGDTKLSFYICGAKDHPI